jgi:signal transduction histidine kinase
MPDTLDPAETGPEPAPPRRGMSVRGHLGIFTAALAAPILLFVGFLLWTIAVKERSRLEDEAGETARTVALALDQEVTGLLASLDVLSLSANLQRGDLRAFHAQASLLLERQGIISVLFDLKGQQLVNVRVPWGTALPMGNMPIDPAIRDPGRAFVTDLYEGSVSGQKVFAVGLSVQREGVPAYVLGFSLPLDRLQRIITQAQIPSDHTLAIIDRNGRIMARNQRPEEFVGRLASQDLRDQTNGPRGAWYGTTVDGQPIFGAYARSRLTGFRVAVGVQQAALNAPLWRSLSLFAAIGLAIVALSVLLGLFFGQRITAPIQSLAERASALGRGEPVEPLHTALSEANQVGAELAHASRVLREREADLREANEEAQRFAYIVSHDLRSPLVNIMGFTSELEALRQDTFQRLEALRGPDTAQAERNADRQLGADFDEAISFIRTSIAKMDRLINAILTLSREGRRTITPEPLDMVALIRGIRDTLQHRLDEADGQIAIHGVLPELVSDRLAIEQVFANVIENAVKYRNPSRPTHIIVRGKTVGPRAIFEIEDNGRGIDPRDHQRVFDLFRRSGAQDQPGEGIGLAHVRALTYRLGGTIDVSSTLGDGASFRINLPIQFTEVTGIAP